MAMLSEIWFVWAIRLVGLGLLAGAVLLQRSTRKFLLSAVRTQGTVVRLESSGSDTMYSIFQFVDRAGHRHEVRSGVASKPPAHKIGQSVKVLYLPDAPKKARLETFFELWFGTAILLVLGTGLVLFSSVASDILRDEPAPEPSTAPALRKALAPEVNPAPVEGPVPLAAPATPTP